MITDVVRGHMQVQKYCISNTTCFISTIYVISTLYQIKCIMLSPTMAVGQKQKSKKNTFTENQSHQENVQSQSRKRSENGFADLE